MDADNMSSSLFAEQLSQIHHMQTVSLQQKQQEVDQLQQMVQSMQGQLQLKDNEIRRLHHQQQPQVSPFVADTPDSNYKDHQESYTANGHGRDKSSSFSNGGGSLNPYQDHHEGGGSGHHNNVVSWLSSWVSPSTATAASNMIRRRRTMAISTARTGGSSSPINGPSSSMSSHSSIRTIDMINCAIIFIVIFHLYHYLTLLTNATNFTVLMKQQQEQFAYYQGQQQQEYQKQLRQAIPSTTYDPINDDDNIQEYFQPQQQEASQQSQQPIKPWESTPPKSIELFDTNNPAIHQRHQCIQSIRQRHNDLLLPLLRSNSDRDGGLEPVLLVDPAYHSNVGDHMLTLGELEFLEGPLRQSYMKEGKDNQKQDLPPPLQCHYIQAGGFFPSCTGVISTSTSKNNHNDKYAMWHAGGNWGDLWRDAQDVRIPSFQTLLQYNYTVIGMPQSLYYANKDLEKQDIQTIKEKITLGLGLSKEEEVTQDEETNPTQGGQGGDHADPYDFEDMWQDSPPVFVNTTILDQPNVRKLVHSKMIFTWREKESYDLAQQLYPFVQNMVVPDIAFQLGPFKPIRRGREQDKVDILILLRADHESQVNQQRNNEYIEKALSEINASRKTHSNEKITFRVTDWPDRLEIFNTRDPFFTTTAIELLSLGKIVVCDRLHAAILSYLVGLPFVYIDQVSGKITKTFNVAFGTTATPVNSNSKNKTEGSNRIDCMDGSRAMWAKEQSLEPALAKAVEFIDRYNLNYHNEGDGTNGDDTSVLSGLRSLFS